jgi:hypothetical protein
MEKGKNKKGEAKRMVAISARRTKRRTNTRIPPVSTAMRKVI